MRRLSPPSVRAAALCALALPMASGCGFDASGLALAPSTPTIDAGDRDSPEVDAAPPAVDAGPVATVLRIAALIDGRSHLILRGATAQWHHLTAAAPGRHEGRESPTIIGGVVWQPSWPDVDDAENYNCNCYSDIVSGLPARLPDFSQTVELTAIDSRSITYIAEQPQESNGFAVVVGFYDRPRESSLYVVDLALQAIEMTPAAE